jgi:hypothetical protein
MRLIQLRFVAVILLSLRLALGADELTDRTESSPSLAEITALLERSSKSYVELRQIYWDPGEDVRLDAVVSPVPAGYPPEHRKGNWDRMAAALARKPDSDKSRYAIQIKVFDEANCKLVWQAKQSIDPAPLARASRKLVADQTLRSRLDVDLLLTFRVPARLLHRGKAYRATLSFLAPGGTEHRFPDGSTVESGPYFVVRAEPLDLDKLCLPTRVSDHKTGVLKRARQIANPGKKQFPRDDPYDCQARSVWCLVAYEGRVYVGYGDWLENRGPIDVWSFAPDREKPSLASQYGRYAFTAGVHPRLVFLKEYRIQEHSIDCYRVSGSKLLLPGIDGHREVGPDGALFGNVYIREKGSWRKLSTLRNVRHVFDAIAWRKYLVAVADAPGSPFLSEDDGLTWKPIAKADGYLDGGHLMPLAGGLLILTAEEACLCEKPGRLNRRRLEVAPGAGHRELHRVTSFRGGVVYSTWDSWGRVNARTYPLYYLKDARADVRLIECFKDQVVRNVVVEGDTLYVLTAKTGMKKFQGEIFATRDLGEWVRLAAFTVPAMPNALARLEGAFYVGLANRGYDPAQGNRDFKAFPYAYADKASGSIWRIER